MSDELLPCPFCGKLPAAPPIGGWTIHCETDDCIGPHTTAENMADATIQWNRRQDNDDPAQTSWHSMDTAPKDGTEILGWWRRSKTHAIIAWSSDGWWKDSADDNMVSAPTHWQYLQDGPSVSSAGNDAQGAMERISLETLAKHFNTSVAYAKVAQDNIGFMYRELASVVGAVAATPWQRALELLEETPAAALRALVIEECAQIAEKLYEKPGWSPGYKNASLAIAGLIRASSMSLGGSGNSWRDIVRNLRLVFYVRDDDLPMSERMTKENLITFAEVPIVVKPEELQRFMDETGHVFRGELSQETLNTMCRQTVVGQIVGAAIETMRTFVAREIFTKIRKEME